MKNFGKNMATNTKYIEGKRLLEAYFSDTDKYIADLQGYIDLYDSTPHNPDELPELAGFNYPKAVKFIRTYGIIRNDLAPTEKNLFTMYLACGCNYDRTLEIFNGENKNGYKNIATLRVIVSKIRKIIRKKYIEKYGGN